MESTKDDTLHAWSRIDIVADDITLQDVDAIVNAANSSLLGGGGVDGAIHRAAGPELLTECIALGGCPTGGARITRGYDLPAKFVIHTVGPVFDDGKSGEPDLLRSCYEQSLDLASQHGLTTIAFPAISCGVYRYPMKQAARIALSTTLEKLKQYEGMRVTFVLFSEHDREAYQRVARELGRE